MEFTDHRRGGSWNVMKNFLELFPGILVRFNLHHCQVFGAFGLWSNIFSKQRVYSFTISMYIIYLMSVKNTSFH